MQQNVINTTHASRNAVNQADRHKVNDSDICFPREPENQHFVEFVREYALTIEDQSQNFKVIGGIIKNDLFYENNEEKEIQQNIIQERVKITILYLKYYLSKKRNSFKNMFDGTRYTAALLKNITSIEIDVNDGNSKLS